MIYISTGGHGKQSFVTTVNDLIQVGLTSFELSGGTYTPNLDAVLIELGKRAHLTLHNYFPPPETPFVFNLASRNTDIVDASINHVKRSVDLTALVGAKYFSFHAGYLIDPKVDELGHKIKNRELNDREESKRLFVERVNDLADYAKLKNVRILIENNVLSKRNFLEFNNNPLLMVEATETDEIMSATVSNVGLLVDVAHLKVSANTLGFSKEDYLDKFTDQIEAYHLSDNAGEDDSNEEVSHKAWFWPYLRKDLEYYSLEIYNVTPIQLKQQYDLTQERLNDYTS